jgi:hypothetical protein
VRDVAINLSANIVSIVETNLLEENINTSIFKGNTFYVSLGAYDIRTFKVDFGGKALPVTIGFGLNRCIGGTVTASGDNNLPQEDKNKVFDGNYSLKWLMMSPTGWIQYQFKGKTAYTIKSYAITAANDAPGRDPKNWILQASNDGVSWVDLDTRMNITFANRFEKRTFAFSNAIAYPIYRLNITANNGAPYLQLGELELYD